MGRLEQAFADVEDAAGAALKSANELARLGKQLQNAAKQGNIDVIKKAQGGLDGALSALSVAVSAAAGSWTLDEADEEAYIRDGYADELREAAAERGLTLHERDGRLFASPSIVHILPGERAVRIDRKTKISAIRPSHLALALEKNQKKPGKYPVDRFLQALYERYVDIVRDGAALRLVREKQARVVPLARIYRQFTSRPGQHREYTTVDFARDLYLLDKSGVTTTRRGAVVSFHASSGTRSPKAGDIFTFVDSDGRNTQYYAIRFTEAA